MRQKTILAAGLILPALLFCSCAAPAPGSGTAASLPLPTAAQSAAPGPQAAYQAKPAYLLGGVSQLAGSPTRLLCPLSEQSGDVEDTLLLFAFFAREENLSSLCGSISPGQESEDAEALCTAVLAALKESEAYGSLGELAFEDAAGPHQDTWYRFYYDPTVPPMSSGDPDYMAYPYKAGKDLFFFAGEETGGDLIFCVQDPAQPGCWEMYRCADFGSWFEKTIYLSYYAGRFL